MCKDISCILKMPQSPESQVFKAKEQELFFVFTKETNVAESKYICNLEDKVLEHYYEEPTDYNQDTNQKQEVCLDNLVDCRFSYSDGSTWEADWSGKHSELPRTIKLIFKHSDDPEPKEVLVNIPVSQ
ncbi:MAG: type II secretion system protein GspJ [Candidatus Omnitrophota bacterium]